MMTLIKRRPPLRSLSILKILARTSKPMTSKEIIPLYIPFFPDKPYVIEDVRNGLTWLKKKGYVNWTQGFWLITNEGLNAVRIWEEQLATGTR